MQQVTRAGLLLCLLLLTPAAQAALTDAVIRDAYHSSYRYEKAQSYADAIKALAPVAEAYPQGYTVNLRLGWLHYLQGSQATARAYYEASMKVAPNSIEAKLGYLLPLLAQERYEEAESVARQIVRIDPANYYANLRLAYALRMQKKNEAAADIVNRQLVYYPTDVSLLLELGLLKVAQELPAEALRVFQDVLTLDPENVVAKAQIARLAPPSPTPSSPVKP